MPVSYYKVLEPLVGAVISQTDTVKRFALGLVARAVNFGTNSTLDGAAMFQYCQGSDVSTAGQFVQIQGNSAVVLTAGASDSAFPIGVAAGPLSATNAYGWVQIKGVCDYVLTTNEDLTVGNPLYINAGTSGLIQTTPVAGNLVMGAVNLRAFSSSGGTGTGTDLLYSNLTIGLNFPHVSGVVGVN